MKMDHLWCELTYNVASFFQLQIIFQLSLAHYFGFATC